MRGGGKLLGRLLLVLFAVFAASWLFEPDFPLDPKVSFDEAALPRDLDEYLTEVEAPFSDIIPGVEKRIIWAGAPGQRTDIAVVYLHGFSGNSEEIRPVPDQVARALGANLYFTRMTGHGRDGAALAEATAGDWLEDTAEALAIGRRLGREVLVISTSTGGTLAAVAATDASQIDGVKGIVFVSPNFRIGHPGGIILRLPFGRWWGRLLSGPEIAVEATSAEHARFFTLSYPVEATFPVHAIAEYARGLDYSGVTTPALFLLSDSDRVISPAAARNVAARWGGLVEVIEIETGPEDDAYRHILAGDVLSPGGTARLTEAMLTWAEGLTWMEER